MLSSFCWLVYCLNHDTKQNISLYQTLTIHNKPTFDYASKAMNTLSANLARIHERKIAACQRVNRNPSEVRLVVVSKTRTADQIQTVMADGQLIFGENRVQEARDKIPLVENPALQWHLIGPLQRNKVKTAVQLFHMIHSVDSLNLAEELSKWADLIRPLPILLQVNLGREPQKSGLMPEETLAAAQAMASLPGIAIQGLMTIPPQASNQEESRHWFRTLAQLRSTIMAQRINGVSMRELSMGMSDDFEIAIEEGATLIRVGSAVFA